jgi:hypothetical protein
MAMIHQLQQFKNPLEGLLQHRFWDPPPHPRISDSVGLGWA